MKRILFIVMVVVMIGGLIVGCAKPAPAPAPAPSPAPAPAPAPAPEKPIELKYNDQNPETGWGAQHAAIPWLKSMEEATNGKVQFTTYFSQSLTKGIDAWEGAKSGIADISWSFHGYWGGMTTLADAVALPFVPWKNSEQGSGALWTLMEEYPALADQFSDNKILICWTTSPYFLITTNKQVKTLEDVKGMKLRLIGGPPTEWAKSVGVSPMSVPMPDTYENMQKGVIDGMGTVWEATLSFKQYEVTKYWTILPMYVGYFTMAMNWDVWNSLGSDIQQQIESVCGLEGSKTYGKNMMDIVEAEARKAAGDGITYYNMPADELAKWQKSAQPLYEQWVADREAEGFSQAQDILDRTLELAGK